MTIGTASQPSRKRARAPDSPLDAAEQPPPAENAPSPASAPNTRTGLACEACRLRKSRCVGFPTCTWCTQRRQPCVRGQNTQTSPLDEWGSRILEAVSQAKNEILGALPSRDGQRTHRQSCQSVQQWNVAPSSQYGPDPARSWWFASVESTLLWPSLSQYSLSNVHLTAIIDAEDEGTVDVDPQYASLRLPLPGRITRGGLDDKAEMTRLVDAFVKHIHVKQPLLDPGLLYDQIAVVEEEGLGWDSATCLLLMACALGGICTPYDHDRLEDYAQPSIDAELYLRCREYFDAGRKRLGLVMGHASIIGAQCFFFAAGYYVTVFRPLAAWRCLHTASMICKNVLMKTAASVAEAPDNSHRKLFWSCLKTEREIASELGFDMASLQLIQYDSLPSLMPDSEPAPSITDPTTLTADQHEQSWFYYLTDIFLRKLEIRIDAFFATEEAKQPGQTTAARESFYHHILTTLSDLDRQIADHSTHLPQSISLETDESGHCPDDLREYLRLRMLIIRHTLSRPALHFILHGDLDGLSVSLRAQATAIANRCLQIDEYLVTHGLTTHRHPGTWLGIRYCVRAALELTATAKSLLHHDLELSQTWAQNLAEFKIALRYWAVECADARVYLEWIERLDLPP